MRMKFSPCRACCLNILENVCNPGVLKKPSIISYGRVFILCGGSPFRLPQAGRDGVSGFPFLEKRFCPEEGVLLSVPRYDAGKAMASRRYRNAGKGFGAIYKRKGYFHPSATLSGREAR